MESKLWENLKFEIESIKLPKINGDEKKIIGSGSLEAKILFIGNDPNLFEDENLRVNAGSGEFLKKLLEAAKFDFKDIYITNIVKANLRLIDIDEKLYLKYREFLDMQIAILKPKIIVFLGQEISKIMFEKEIKISDIRGKIYKWNDIPVMPLYDPYFLVRQEVSDKNSPKWLTWQDIKLLKKVLDEG